MAEKYDVTRDEWEEWRHMPQTKELLRRLKALHYEHKDSLAHLPEEKWNGMIHRSYGVLDALSLAENLHKE